jgi:hypothetical protein
MADPELEVEETLPEREKVTSQLSAPKIPLRLSLVACSIANVVTRCNSFCCLGAVFAPYTAHDQDITGTEWSAAQRLPTVSAVLLAETASTASIC